VKVQFAAEYFKVHESSDNGTYHVVETLQKGFTTFHGELLSVTVSVSAAIYLRSFIYKLTNLFSLVVSIFFIYYNLVIKNVCLDCFMLVSWL